MALDAEYYHNNSSLQFGLANDILEAISFQGNETLLDIGCGDGKITASLAGRLPSGSVIGLDASEEMIAFAKSNFSKPNLNFVVNDARSLVWKDHFDWIVSFSCLHWVRPQEEVFAAIKKALKPGGKALILTFPGGTSYSDSINEAINCDPFQSYRIDSALLLEDEYRAIIEKIGFKESKMIVKPRIASYETPSLLKDYIRGWLPSLIPLPSHLQEPFLDHVASLAPSYSIDKGDGQIHLCYATIEISLTR